MLRCTSAAHFTVHRSQAATCCCVLLHTTLCLPKYALIFVSAYRLARSPYVSLTGHEHLTAW